MGKFSQKIVAEYNPPRKWILEEPLSYTTDLDDVEARSLELVGVNIKDKTILECVKNSNLPLYNFLLKKWYIDEIYDFIFIKPLKKIGVFFWKKGDQDTIDRYGPDGISKFIKFISNKAIQFQSGYIYDYAFVMLIGLSALITYLILN